MMKYEYLLFRRTWQHAKLSRYRRIVSQANALEGSLANLTDDQLAQEVCEVHTRAQAVAKIDGLLARALAIGREVSKRKTTMRHYDVQLMGTLALYDGCIAEMDTGEGKTLMAPLAAFLHRLGKPGTSTHIVTANEYLAERDAKWMLPLCQGLGMSVGLIVPGQSQSQRVKAYGCDIVYATAKEVVFDSLREPIRRKKQSAVDVILRPQDQSVLDPKYDFAIVDEVDSVLIDQAQSPFSIGGASRVSPQLEIYRKAGEIAGKLIRGTHYRLLYDDRTVEMKDQGKAEAHRLAGDVLRKIPPGHNWQRYVTCALAARYIYKQDQQYVVHEGRIVLIDETTGRMIPGRQLPDGIHQALEIQNGIIPTAELRGNYTTTFQTYFRKYDKLAGMTGTATMACREFLKVYDLPIVPVPPNKPSHRHILPDRVYRHRKAKLAAIVKELARCHNTNRPLLIATGSVKGSEEISAILTGMGLEHEVLNAKNHAREAAIIAQAGQAGRITVITNMAGRGVDIVLGDGVAEMGGIMLISTDRLFYRRWDNQLAGRIGRQGDPGDCQFFLSLRDELLRRVDRKKVLRLRKKTRGNRNSLIELPQAAKLFEKLQHRIENLTGKHRHRVYQSEKQREKLKEDGLWEDWMDIR